MVIRRFADVIDEKLQTVLEDKGAELAEKLSDVYAEHSDDISEDEFMEFVKRNMKNFPQEIQDTVKDNL